MSNSKIPYTDLNWETVGGCDKIKRGCLNCYAIGLIRRFSCNPIHRGRYEGLVKDGNWTGKIELFEDRLEQPLHRTIPTTYFVNSRSDTFHKDVPIGFLTHMFDVIKDCPQHTFLLFTKRYNRVLPMMWGPHGKGWRYFAPGTCHPNVHLYFSASTQAEVDEAVPILLQIPVEVRGFGQMQTQSAYSLQRLLRGSWLPKGIR